MKNKYILIIICFFTMALRASGQSLDIERLKDILTNVVSVSSSGNMMKNVEGKNISITYSPEKKWELKIDFYHSNVKMEIYENLFYVGDYRLENGEYVGFGDSKIVTIKYDFRSYPTHDSGLIKDGKPTPSYKIAFKDSSSAMDFVRLLNEYSSNSLEHNGWWRQMVDNEKYEDKNSKQMFNILHNDLKSTRITYGYPSEFKTSSVSIKYSYPNLIISFVNASKYPGYWDDDMIGSFIMSFPLNNAVFQSPYYGRHDGKMIIYSKEGITVKHKGQTTTKEEIEFYLTKKDCERIVSEFRVLKRKILSENYRGSYPVIRQKSDRTNNSKNISDKYVQ